MSRENVDIARAHVRALNDRDVIRAGDHFADDFELIAHGGVMAGVTSSGTINGVQPAARGLADWFRSSQSEDGRFEVVKMGLHLREGRIVGAEGYGSLTEALEAVGLTE